MYEYFKTRNLVVYNRQKVDVDIYVCVYGLKMNGTSQNEHKNKKSTDLFQFNNSKVKCRSNYLSSTQWNLVRNEVVLNKNL